MGKEARSKAAKKTMISTIMLSERDRFQCLNYLNAVVATKGHAQLRQLNRVYDALSLDDFPPGAEKAFLKRSAKLEPFDIDGGSLDFLVEQLGKDAPGPLGIYTLRYVGLILDRIKRDTEAGDEESDQDDENTEPTKLESVAGET